MREFQAIILAGVGENRMYPVTNESLGKAMLPVCNVPVISYVLHSFVRARIDETFIVTNAEIAKEISVYLAEVALPIKVEFEITTGDGSEEGTADALRTLVDKIESNDVFVVSCDLITTLPLHRLADIHRLNDASVTCLFAEPQKVESDGPGDRRPKLEGSEDYVGFAADGKRVVLLKSQADCIDLDELKVSRRLLQQHPSMTVHTNLMDAHCYILSKAALLLMKERTNLNSLRRDFIPYLVKQSTRLPPANPTPPVSTPGARGDISLMRLLSVHDIQPVEPTLSCYALVLPASETVLCSRASSMYKLLELHRVVPRYLKKLMARAEDEEEAVTLVATTAAVHPNASVGPDSMVGVESTIGEQTSLKRSAVGSHCVIGERVKLVNSVVLDYVTIAAGCTIQNSVISRSAQVQAGVTMTNCQVAPSFTVPEKSAPKNEALAASDDFF